MNAHDLACWHWRMQAQTAHRRQTGRELQRGDVLRLENGRYVEVIRAGSAGECMEAAVEIQILKRRTERRDSNRE